MEPKGVIMTSEELADHVTRTLIDRLISDLMEAMDEEVNRYNGSPEAKSMSIEAGGCVGPCKLGHPVCVEATLALDTDLDDLATETLHFEPGSLKTVINQIVSSTLRSLHAKIRASN
jgi:hypothetical protein